MCCGGCRYLTHLEGQQLERSITVVFQHMPLFSHLRGWQVFEQSKLPTLPADLPSGGKANNRRGPQNSNYLKCSAKACLLKGKINFFGTFSGLTGPGEHIKGP